MAKKVVNTITKIYQIVIGGPCDEDIVNLVVIIR